MVSHRRKAKEPSGRPQLSTIDERGHELPDSTPFSPSLKLRRAATVMEQMQQFIRTREFMKEFEQHETFEEADDFDVDDDFDPSTPYEEFFEGEFNLLRQARLEEWKESTQRARRGRQAAPAEPEKVRSAPQKEISDGADPTPGKRKRGSASKEISDGETPT